MLIAFAPGDCFLSLFTVYTPSLKRERQYLCFCTVRRGSSLHHHVFTRLSGSSDSRPRNKSRIVPFLNGFEWKTGNKNQVQLKRRHWRRTKLGLQKASDIKWHTCCVLRSPVLSNQVTVRTSLLSEQLMGEMDAWLLMFPASSLAVYEA